jgi:hypothetical protein
MVLPNHLFSSNFTFISDSLNFRGGGKSSMFCGYILLLAGPILWRWTDIGRPDLSEALSWAFACKMHAIEQIFESSKFKSGKYGSQSAENRNVANGMLGSFSGVGRR